MPPKKLNSLYIAKLFENDSRMAADGGDGDCDIGPTLSSGRYNVNSENDDGDAALRYLTKVRGLDRNTLRKYGIGCARYNFPIVAGKEGKKKDGGGGGSSGVSYASSTCVTFPWMMRTGEVAELEEMRGAQYVWRPTAMDVDGDSLGLHDAGVDSGGADVEKEDSVAFSALTKTTKKKKDKPVAEMTALERYHYRKERKKMRQLEREERDDAKRKEEERTGQPCRLPQSRVGEKGVGGAGEDEEDDDEADIESIHGPYIARRIKARSIEQKSWQRLDPPGGGSGLFGWHTVPHSASELIITEGEFDAMAVYQATGRPAVSLPNGCRSFPTDILVLMERFDTIYIWMDNDGPGQEGAETFAKKLGVERCLVVRPSGKRGWRGREANDANDGEHADVDDAIGTSRSLPPAPPKDANEALLTGWDINELLEEATEIPHERILTFADLRDQVIHEIINPEKYRGGE
jgi:hypothetical protein